MYSDKLIRSQNNVMDIDNSVDAAAVHMLKGKQGDIFTTPRCRVS